MATTQQAARTQSTAKAAPTATTTAPATKSVAAVTTVAPVKPVVRVAAPTSAGAPVATFAARPLKVAPPVMRLREGTGAAGASAAGAGAKRAANEQGAQLAKSAGAGEPLPPSVRGALEKSLKVDLKDVRVHKEARTTETVDALSSRAITYGAHIFLGSRERATDLALIAHEAAHVVQQRGAQKKAQHFTQGSTDAYEGEAHRAASAVVRGEQFEVRERVSRPRILRLGISDALDYFADKANIIPGYRMFTILLGVNPINMSPVDRSAANILRAIVEFIPGGNLITRALDSYGVFERVGAWVEGQLRTLGLTGAMFRQAIMDFLNSLGWRDIFHLGDVWDRAKRIFTEPISRLITFAGSLITGILGFLREAVLRPLAALAQNTPGYDLLKAVLGQDPVTGEAVPRTADTLIGGFMKLIGQEEIWNNLKRANAVARAWAWFQGALSGLMGFVRQIPGMIVGMLSSIGIEDFLPITNLFGKVVRTFGGFFGSFLSWAGGQVMDLLKIIFEVVAPSVMPYVMKAAGAFRTIIRNPIGFVGNLVRAGVQGFRQFAANFLGHLRKSLIDWLTGTLSGASIYVPQSFSLKEVVKFVLSVLGLTWANVRPKLVAAMTEPVVVALETTFDIVVTLVKDGPAAAWDKIKDYLSNLKDMVMEQVISFVKGRVIDAAIQKLLTSLNPAGAFIQAIIAIYNTIMFFVERLRQIAQVVAAFIDSISAIASGNIGSAASRVETTMAGMLTLLVSFLARIAGLGKVSDAVLGIVKKVRDPIDKALDKVIAWIVATAKRIGAFAKATAKSIMLRFTKPKSFSAAGETHQMWVTEQGEPQVASSAMPLGTRIGTWKRRVSSLPAADQANATAQIGVADGINGDLRKAAADALRARTAGDAAAVDAAQKIIDGKQAALQPALSTLFTLFKDTATAAGAEQEARIFALVETYDQVVVPLKRAGLVGGTPSTVSKTFKSQWNRNQIAQARGWLTQMERVLGAARNVGTGRFPYLVGVEVKIPGTEIDYSVRARDIEGKVNVDVAVEVKNWGAMRDRKAASGRVVTVAEQIQQRINTLRNQVTSALRNPTYTAVVAEIRGYGNIPDEMRAALNDEFINYRGLADSMKPKKRFSWRRI